jgi:hypothetical protein
MLMVTPLRPVTHRCGVRDRWRRLSSTVATHSRPGGVDFATAAAHVAVVVVALVAGLGPTLPADAFFIGAWVASGLLFRQARVEPSPSA